MSRSNKTRYTLWGKAGGRCSICKKELTFDSTLGEKINHGEVCHIISSKKNGPRYKILKDYDEIENLILLCRNHHTEIDTCRDTYSEELLRYIKENHEKWVKQTLSDSVSKNTNKPRFLSRITSGKEIYRIITNSHYLGYDYDETDSEKIEDLKHFFQLLMDYGDISGDLIEIAEAIEIEQSLSKELKELESKGYVLFGEKTKRKGKENKNWYYSTFIIKKKESNDIIWSNPTEENNANHKYVLRNYH